MEGATHVPLTSFVNNAKGHVKGKLKRAESAFWKPFDKPVSGIKLDKVMYK